MKFLKQKNGDGFTSIEHELAGQLADRLARHKALSDELAEKRAEAEAALAGRRGFLLSDNIADDKQRKAVDARVVAAQSAELGVEDALSVVAARINELRQQISEERNKAARAKAAKELHDRADALDRKLEVARISCVELSEVLDSMPALPLESVDFRSRVKTLLVEVPAAVAQFANDIRKHAERIKAGQEPVPGKSIKVEQPAAPKLAEIERRDAYLLVDGKWRENGELKTAQRYALVALPIEIANRAIEHNLAVDPASETCARLKVVHGIRYGITYADLCTDLESGEKPGGGPKYFDEESEVRIGPAVTGVATVSQ